MVADLGSFSPRQLTRRQEQCVALVAKGMSSKEIARELGISPSTVDNHIAAVMHQLNLPSRTAIARLAAAGHGQDAGTGRLAEDRDWIGNFCAGIDQASGIKPEPDTTLIRGIKTYAFKSLVPSFVLAVQCSLFLILFYLILRGFFHLPI